MPTSSFRFSQTKISPLVIALAALFFVSVTGFLFFEKSILLPTIAFASLFFLFLVFQKPVYALSLLLIVRISIEYTSTFVNVSYEDFSITLAQLIGLAVAVLGFLIIIPRYYQKLRSYPLLWPSLLIAIWGVSTLGYSISSNETLRELVRFFDIFLVGFFAYAITKTQKDFQTLLQAILFSSLIPLSIAWYQFFMGIGITDESFSTPRIFATFAHPNVFSLYLFFLLVALTIYWTLSANTSRKQVLCIILGGITGLLLLLTFSRFAWIATFLFFCLYALWYKRVYLLPLIVLPIILTLLSTNIQERVLEAFNPLPDSSIVWRQEFWHDNLQKTTQDDRRIIGYGMSTFPLVAAPLRPYTLVPIDAHNDFIKFFVEGGYIGLTVYTIFVLSILWILFSAYKKSIPQLKPLFLLLLFAYFCLIVASLSDNIWRATAVQWLFYILTGSALALSSHNTKK